MSPSRKAIIPSPSSSSWCWSLLAAFAVVGFNKLRATDVGAQEALGGIDVQLTRRADLIPNLVDTVKGYAAHEKGVFEEVTAPGPASRRPPRPATTYREGRRRRRLQGAVVNVNAVAEAYPDLKANENFLELQAQLAETENQLSFARQYYNDAVAKLNTLDSHDPVDALHRHRRPGKEFYESRGLGPGAHGVVLRNTPPRLLPGPIPRRLQAVAAVADLVELTPAAPSRAISQGLDTTAAPLDARPRRSLDLAERTPASTSVERATTSSEDVAGAELDRDARPAWATLGTACSQVRWQEPPITTRSPWPIVTAIESRRRRGAQREAARVADGDDRDHGVVGAPRPILSPCQATESRPSR